MSTTVREEYEVGDLDPSAVLEAAARQRTRARTTREFRKLQLAAHWADLHPATTDTGVETPGGRRAAGRRVTRRGRHPGGGGVHPRTVRVGVGHVTRRWGAADRRRPRRPPPAPLLWKRVSRLEVPAWQARRVARQTHRLPKAAAMWVDEQLTDRTSCGPVIVDRLVAQAIAAYDPEEPRRPGDQSQGRLGRDPHPPRGHRLPGHLPPRGHRRHPGPQSLLRPGLRHRPPAVPRRRHLAVGRAQGQGPRHPHRPTHHHGQRDRSRSTPASRPTTSNPTPSPSARSRSSAPPPSPRSATGSATTRSSSNPSSTWPDATPSTPTTHHRWMRDLVLLRDSHCIFPRCHSQRQVLRPRPHHPLRP